MQLDPPDQHRDTPQSDPPQLDARDALEAFGRLPKAAVLTPPSALSVELPDGDSIDCYELAGRIADVVETPCCKVATVGRTRRAIASSTALALGPRRTMALGTEPELKDRLASYRGAPYSPDWDPGLELLSPMQHRRLAERARRMQDFQQRVKRGVLRVFTHARDATEAVGASTYMTRNAARQYLLDCGFGVAGADDSSSSEVGGKVNFDEPSHQEAHAKDADNSNQKLPGVVQRQGLDTSQPESSANPSRRYVNGKAERRAGTRLNAWIDDFVKKNPGSAEDIYNKLISIFNNENAKPEFVLRRQMVKRQQKGRVRPEMVVVWENEHGAESDTGMRAIKTRIKDLCEARKTT